MIQLNMEKAAAGLRLSLAKHGIDISKLHAQVIIALDVSGSFEVEHNSGATNDLLTRLVPWGLVFDPNGEIDVFTFSDGKENAHHVGVVDKNTYEGYVRSNIIDQVPGWNGGTDYSYVLEKSLAHFGWLPKPSVARSEYRPSPPKKKGFFERLFGDSDGEDETASQRPSPPLQPEAVKKDPSLVIMITDGASDERDKNSTRRVLAESQARGDEVYFLFIGYSKSGNSTFSFLKEIADKYDNTGLVVVENLEHFTNLPEEELNGLLIGEELVKWLKAE